MFVPCEPWSSRTCTRRRSGPSTGASCSTRSRRCGAATTSRSRSSPSRPGCAPTRPPRASCAAATARGEFDVVHAHFGLTAWPALLARLGPVVVTLHGNDLFHPRSNRITRAALPFTALPAAVSREFSENIPGAGTTRRVAVLPVGIDLRPLPPDPAARGARAARAGPRRPVPAVPARPRAPAQALRPRAGGRRRRAAAADGPRPARRGPVLDQRRQRGARALAGRGLRAVGDRGDRLRRARVRHARSGIHPVALHGIEGALCAPYDRDAWRAALRAAARRPPTRAWTGRAPRRAVLGRPHGRARGRGLARPAGGARRDATLYSNVRGASNDAPRRP